jgi:hypothetical protein
MSCASRKTPCTSTRICNPASGRCVLKTGVIGKALLKNNGNGGRSSKKKNGNWKAEVAKIANQEFQGRWYFDMGPSGFAKQVADRIKEVGIDMDVSVPEVRPGDVLKGGFINNNFVPIKSATVGGLFDALLNVLRQTEATCPMYHDRIRQRFNQFDNTEGYGFKSHSYDFNPEAHLDLFCDGDGLSFNGFKRAKRGNVWLWEFEWP